MLAAAQRLRRGNEFAAAIRRGRRAGRGAVVVHLDLADPTTSPTSPTASGRRGLWKPARVAGAEVTSAPARAGFVVSRAVGGAVVRNRIRRRLRHLVRDRISTLPAGATLVVRALPEAAALSHARLGADLDAAITAVLTARRPSRRPR